MPAGPPLRDRGVLNVVLPAGVTPADVARPEIDLGDALRDELDLETIRETDVGLGPLLTEHESVENFIRPDVALNVTWPGEMHFARSPADGGPGGSPELVVIPPRNVGVGRIRPHNELRAAPGVHTSPPVRWEVFVSGRNNNRPISFLQQGQQLATGIGMVVIPGVGFGTCFLVTDNLIMTNNHVLPSADVARGATIVFNFQNRLDGKPTRPLRVGLAPDTAFHTSPKPKGNPSARHLDYSLVKLERALPAKQRPLMLGEFEIAELQDVIVIHHPDGLPKQITLAGTEVQFVDKFKCQYLADTTNGSSGAPVFNDRWELVALHHIGGVSQPDAPNTTRNQGVRITAILDSVPPALRSEIDDCRRGAVSSR